MKKKSIFISVMLMLVVGLVLTAADKKKSVQKSTGNNVLFEALDCSTNVPTDGQTGEVIQFNGPSCTSDIPGGLAAEDPIIGNLRFVPATSAEGFLQGSPLYEPGHEGNEGPLFYHVLTRKLAVMETEVTIQMWADLKVEQPSLPADPSVYITNSNYPVHRVTWQECILFANLLSLQKGLIRCYYTDSSKTTPITGVNYTSGSIYCDFEATGYRLPSEGEWEYFCRAGTNTPFSILEPKYDTNTRNSCNPLELTKLTSVAIYCSTNSIQTAGSKNPNNWNIKDTHGNVKEWCWDGYDLYPDVTTQTDYTGLDTSPTRVLRGGYWASQPHFIRSARRYDNAPDASSRLLEAGFRLVRKLN
jgi:formylglycine-generating enzyme required for sulfatase activity